MLDHRCTLEKLDEYEPDAVRTFKCVADPIGPPINHSYGQATPG
jgi:hypothetical protein